MSQQLNKKISNTENHAVDGRRVALRPGSREPWFWIIISPLVLVLVACAITISIAVINADDVVVGNYYKQGLAVNEEFSLAENAKSLGLVGEIYFNKLKSTIQVDFLQTKNESLALLPQELVLHLSHPAERSEDKNIVLLKKSTGIYSGNISSQINNRWYWQLSPSYSADQLPDYQRWQLTGELFFSARDETRVSF